MKSDVMDATRKTAIFLLSLDQSMAAEILGRLPRDSVEQIALAIASADAVTREQQESVLTEFKVAFAARPLIQAPGSETARELLQRSLDLNEIEPTQQRFEEQVHAGPFAFLHRRHPDDIRKLIESEYPQTIAVVVSKLPSELASNVLAGLEVTTRTEVLARMARLGPTETDLLIEIASILESRIGRSPTRFDAMTHTADVLRDSPRTVASEFLQQLEQKDGHLAQSLKEAFFTFADLEAADNETLALAFQETAQHSWAVALKGSSEKLRQKILRVVPAGTAKQLQTEIQSFGPLRLSEIRAAQQEITQVIVALEAEGEIKLPRKQSNQASFRQRSHKKTALEN